MDKREKAEAKRARRHLRKQNANGENAAESAKERTEIADAEINGSNEAN